MGCGGSEELCFEHLCRVNLTLSLYYIVQILHSFLVLGHVSRTTPGRERELPDQSPVYSSLQELNSWQSLTQHELEDRAIHAPTPTAYIHKDYDDVGYDGTLHKSDMRSGVYGQFDYRGMWKWEDRARSIT